MFKRFGFPVVLAFSALLGGIPAGAQEFPSKPIEIIVGFAPGGGTDMAARSIAEVASKYLGQPVVVNNKTGASGMIGAQYAYNAKPDGYTLLVAGGSETVSLPHYKKLPFNPVADFDPVMRIMVEHFGFYVKADSPLKSMKDLIEQAKIRPANMTYAAAGVGSLAHATVQVTEKRTGISVTLVPTKGGADSLTALAGGHVDFALASPNEAFALVEAGRVRSLATSALKRSPTEPTVPTLRELGYDVYTDNQKGLVLPKGVPQPIKQKLVDAFKKAYDDPQFMSTAEKLKLEISYLNSEDFRKALQAMYDQIGDSVKPDPEKPR